MSWLLGAINVSTSAMNEARGLVSQTPFLFTENCSPSLLLAAGGLPDTCHYTETPTPDAGWAVSGVGLRLEGDGSRIYTASDWHTLFSGKPTELLSQRGHFAAMYWDAQGVHCFTDPVGIRTLYFARSDNGVLFSTNLTWMARLCHAHDLDYEVLGARWLTHNQISTESPIKGIQRLGPGGYLYINKTGYFRTTESPWIPSWKSSSREDFMQSVTRFTKPRLPGERSLSMGLAGGLDSRLLLASRYVLSPPRVHTYGHESSQDAKIALKISESLELNHGLYQEDVLSEAQCITHLQNNAPGNHGILTASDTIALHYITRLHNEGYAMIDGRFGQVLRRQFQAQLLEKGKKHLLKDDFEKVLPLLVVPRPDIFNPLTLQIMQEGVLKQFMTRWIELPSHKEIGLENKLDLLHVQSRLPNFFGFEQQRLDGCILSYIPFAQHDVLDNLFGLPARQRKKGKLFKSLIRKMHRPLAGFPLAKADPEMPFLPPAFSSKGMRKPKKRGRGSASFTTQHQILQKLKTYALDRVHSGDVREYPAYNYQAIQSNVTDYYKGYTAQAGFVDWWLAFDTWRQQVTEPV